MVLHRLKRFEEALTALDRALEVQPHDAEALVSRGAVLYELKRYDEALASLERALTLRPDHAMAFYNRGAVLHQLERFEEALKSHQRGLALRPGYVPGLFNQGTTLNELKQFEGAVESFDRAIEIKPDYADALVNRGLALGNLNRFDEALASYDRALALQPHNGEALLNRGITLKDMKRFDEALASIDQALALRPDFFKAALQGALTRLLIGDFDRGWQWFGRRLRRRITQPLWLGSNDVAGRTILLVADEGLGDTMQFCRYVPLVAERGGRVILEVQAPLRGLIGNLPGIAEIISRGDLPPDFDVYCPLHGLPLAFGTRLDTIPAAVPYLSASPQRTNDWRERLESGGRARIGFAWSSNRARPNDHRRSIPLEALLPLLDADATFVSLQYGVRPGDAAMLARTAVIDLGEELKEFSEMAAVIASLDLVISADTSVVHLAGALAKPVWVMLPFVPDWRWLLDRDDSPWYPTARLFRQDETRTWDSVIAQVGAALAELIQQRQPAAG